MLLTANSTISIDIASSSFSEAVSGNEAGELQKVKEESAKHVAKLQRQKEQLESQVNLFLYLFWLIYNNRLNCLI